MLPPFGGADGFVPLASQDGGLGAFVGQVGLGGGEFRLAGSAVQAEVGCFLPLAARTASSRSRVRTAGLARSSVRSAWAAASFAWQARQSRLKSEGCSLWRGGRLRPARESGRRAWRVRRSGRLGRRRVS